MAEAVLSLLAFLVFAALWLSTQDWFDLLPRRATRAFAGGCTALLAVTCYAAPSAFQAGFTRFVNRAAEAANERIQNVLRDVFDATTPSPAPLPSPTPTAPRP
jgi:hypothetical protein